MRKETKQRQVRLQHQIGEFDEMMKDWGFNVYVTGSEVAKGGVFYS